MWQYRIGYSAPQSGIARGERSHIQARWTPEKKLSVTELEFKLLLGKWGWLLKGKTAQMQSTLMFYPDCFSGSSEHAHLSSLKSTPIFQWHTVQKDQPKDFVSLEEVSIRTHCSV